MKRKITLTESQFNRLVKNCVKKALNEMKGNVNVDKIINWANNSAEELMNGSNACYFYPLGKSNCKTNKMYLVIGWSGGFDEAEEGELYADGQYRVCCKLAYNCDSMQCDYDIDWEMPYDEESGEVDDTDTEYSEYAVAYLIQYWQKNYAI